MPSKTKVEEIMTKGVFTVQIDDTVRMADEIIHQENVRHVPVLDGKRFIGLITERTLMEYTLRQLYDFEDDIEDIGRNRIIDFQQVMSKDVYVIYPEDSVKKAVEIMAKRKIDCLPVVDWENNLVGIITSVDILLFFNNKLS